jgi:hypothetical protein
MVAIKQPDNLKLALVANSNFREREKRVVETRTTETFLDVGHGRYGSFIRIAF